MNRSLRSLSFCVVTLVVMFPAMVRAQSQCETLLANSTLPMITCGCIDVNMHDGSNVDVFASGTPASIITSSLLGNGVINAGLNPLTRAFTLDQGYDGGQSGTTLFNQIGGLTHGPSVPIDGHSSLNIVSGSVVHFWIDNPNPFAVGIDVGISSHFTTDLSDPTGAGADIAVALALAIYQQRATEPIYALSGSFAQTTAGVQTTGIYNDAEIIVGNTSVSRDFTDPESLIVSGNSRQRLAAARMSIANLRVVGPNASVNYDAGTTHTISLFTTAPGVTITVVPEPAAILLWLYVGGLLYLWRFR